MLSHTCLGRADGSHDRASPPVVLPAGSDAWGNGAGPGETLPWTSDSALALIPRSILRHMAKSPNSISSMLSSAARGCRQSRRAWIRVSSRVPSPATGDSFHAQVLSDLLHSSHRLT